MYQVEHVRCPRCRGNGTIMGVGMMEHKCLVCDGKRFIEKEKVACETPKATPEDKESLKKLEEKLNQNDPSDEEIKEIIDSRTKETNISKADPTPSEEVVSNRRGRKKKSLD